MSKESLRVLDGIHTIPVPFGWSPEQAWETILRLELFPADVDRYWLNVRVENGCVVEVIDQ